MEAKESGKRSASHLVEGGSSIVAAASAYKRHDKACLDGGKGLSATCGYCVKSGHDASRQERVKKCPSYGKNAPNVVSPTT